MSNRRLLKAAEAIREVVASAILTEIRDPRVHDVTVINVQVTPDMREAKVAVSVMGNEAQQQLAIRGLQNSAGFLQSKIAKRIEARYTPKLSFTLDKGIQNALVVGELLAQIKREKEENGQPSDPVDVSMDENRTDETEGENVDT
ncbi:Ribosome-binding factor A [Novipirellula aureliae]|uniref:Ribosome-binding factor A n=1 Tax=Novipirellula aureliae TaxID=2527966 RepID=A0A5C6E645_9BACT|nr:30S ribosome-binding factor RbfA [Novipirellula aureliae]TWU43101.1 Ribosome-binding factor A [Novipirellula aureliae]